MRDDGQVVLAVSDDGEGRGDRPDGTGLSIVRALVRDELEQRLRLSPGVRRIRDEVSRAVLAGELPATVAADQVLSAYDAPTPGG